MSYIPRLSNIIWLDFSPQAGREQANRRPAIVMSPSDYNAKIGLVLVLPITSKVKGYPFEVSIPKGIAVSGVILSDQIKSLDWRIRKAEFICKAPDALTAVIMEKLKLLLPYSS